MKTSILALAALSLGSLVAAAPLKAKRDEDIVWFTQVEVVTKVEESTVTVWVDALPTPPPVSAPVAAPAPAPTPVTSAAQFFEKPKVNTPPPPPPPTTLVTSTSSAAPVVVAPSPQNVAPVQTTPVVVPAPITTAAPVAPSPTPSPSPSTPAAAPAGNQGSTSPATGATYTGGDITFYDPSGGYGSCGTTIQNGDDVVALPFGLMDAISTKSNGHPWCGRKVAIYYGGQTYTATVQDKCMGCSGNDIDMTSGLFKKICGNSVDGRGKGLAKWSFI